MQAVLGLVTHVLRGRRASSIVAHRVCRIRLRSVRHAYGRHLEAVGDHKAAMQQYVASGTAGAEVRCVHQ